MKNTQVILARRPVGVPKPEHFELRETDVPALQEGQCLIHTSHWSVDPAMRGWANDVPNYSPPVALGDPMRSFAVGEVIASRHPDYAEGDVVEGLLGWQTHVVTDGANIGHKVTETDLPRSYALGIMGLNGTTAYFGLRETCAAKAGDTVVVSTAAGAVGSAVGQIAKVMGCRTVGIAGGAEKTRQCLAEFGYDAAIDYKSEDVATAIAAACPDGVDCYFDNTCGPITDAVMTKLAQGARITICGTAAITEWDPLPIGPRVHRQLLVARARMQGFLIFDYMDRLHEARDALAGWLRAGKITVREHILDGPGAAPGAIEMLYKGENTGKLIIKVG
ncbi:NADP-dependent oxidoreductase [Nioella nitratireducens]|uniref:NADP-dependent oxidoreductase n=1 Tax=Nioella nitratireducens TaxID=1287720 RepID=UPI0008FD4DA8|nr:NADP-dependent oxidoreductase [Nioella nitratireducens]